MFYIVQLFWWQHIAFYSNFEQIRLRTAIVSIHWVEWEWGETDPAGGLDALDEAEEDGHPGEGEAAQQLPSDAA